MGVTSQPMRRPFSVASAEPERVAVLTWIENPPAAPLDRLVDTPILHHMAKLPASQLDRTFAALVDPTRRHLLSRLEREESVSITELTRDLPIKLPAVMKHLDVLTAAGLISRRKTGRVVTVKLAPEPMEEAMAWLRRYERFWSANLDRLALFVEEESDQ